MPQHFDDFNYLDLAPLSLSLSRFLHALALTRRDTFSVNNNIRRMFISHRWGRRRWRLSSSSTVSGSVTQWQLIILLRFVLARARLLIENIRKLNQKQNMLVGRDDRMA